MGDIVENESSFYSNAEDYWREVPPTVDGMLGGYGSISNIDINGSKAFLQRFLGVRISPNSPDPMNSSQFLCLVLKEGQGKTTPGCALDCGAGIGRITKRLLLPLFKTVDLVDVTQEFLDKAKTYLGEDGKRVGHYFCCGLQDFKPESGRYDVIWIQWVIGHLTDEHLVDFLQRCQKSLRPNGLIVIKDNVSYEGVVPDDVDSSVCRDMAIVRGLVSRAGLRIVHEEQQTNFPKEIYQVHTLALR
ncbi:N-terminal Xaa-Pro-Lys N-methyltransferase 1 [Neosynchiropus ocellatus]